MPTWASSKSPQSEYFRNLGYSIYRIAETGYFDTVVAKATLEYKASARIDDMLDLHTRVFHLGNTSMIMDSEIYRQHPEELLLQSQIIYVGFDIPSSSKKEIPKDIRAVVQEYEATGQVLPMSQLPDPSPCDVFGRQPARLAGHTQRQSPLDHTGAIGHTDGN